MKQTAVEWYAEQSQEIRMEEARGNISTTEMITKLSDILKQALEMEQKQLAKEYHRGSNDAVDDLYKFMNS
jgi:hypothetical protein